MSRGKRIAVIAGGLVVAAGVIVFGVIGIGSTVRDTTQTTVCGVKVGATVTEGTVRLLGVSEESLSPGDRVRVNPLCVVEVVGIEDRELPAGYDGSKTDVKLRWGLW